MVAPRSPRRAQTLSAESNRRRRVCSWLSARVSRFRAGIARKRTAPHLASIVRSRSPPAQRYGGRDDGRRELVGAVSWRVAHAPCGRRREKSGGRWVKPDRTPTHGGLLGKGATSTRRWVSHEAQDPRGGPVGFCLALTAAPALGDPAFGPGNQGGGQGNSGPQVGKCH